MIHTLITQPKPLTVAQTARRAAIKQNGLLLAVVGCAMFMAVTMWSDYPHPSHIAWVLFWMGVLSVLYNLRSGIYIIIGGALAGDGGLTPWYPFTKNLSSVESLLYFNDSFSFTPLEIFIALTFGLWILRMALAHKWEIRWHWLLLPVAIFTGTAAFGLIRGIMTNGDFVMALWESRAIFYILPVALLVSSLIETRAQVMALMWTILLAIAVDGLYGTWHVVMDLNWDLSFVDSIGEHSMSIHFNAFIVLFLASLMLRGSYSQRITMATLMPFVLIAYFANNRRAAFISLAIALVVFGLVLFRFDRRKFWMIAPPIAILGLAYIAIFWNIDGPIGAPAQAIRSVIGQPDPRDASSNLYREYENANLMFTIKTASLLGVGFGHKFIIIIPMGDISGLFPFWEYITHNSMLYIWAKTGVLGFFSLLLLIGSSIATGARTLWRMPSNDMAVAALTALCYLIMHFIFAYVDMSWAGVNMVMVGAMIGVIICLVPIVAHQPPAPEKRWSWQPAPEQVPGLRPVRGEILP